MAEQTPETQPQGDAAPATPAKGRSDLIPWLLLAAAVVLAVAVVVMWLTAGSKVPDYVGAPLEGDAKAKVVAQNSPLTDYVFLTQNADFPRTDGISRITIHHMAGDLDLGRLGEKFARRDTQASSNYAIGSDGTVALYVEEGNRAWTSNDRENDHQAVTIEVANDEMEGDWHVSDAAFEKLVELCADICERNGIEELVFTEDGQGSLNYHGQLDSSTQCPGPYLKSRMGDLAAAVNERLQGRS